MNRPLYALAALAASFALVAAACGGDDGGDGDGPRDAGSTATAAATSEPTSEATEAASTPSGEATSAATSAPGGEQPGSLEEVYDSYHYSSSLVMTIEGLGELLNTTSEGDFVAPDRRRMLTNTGAMGFGTTFETITIGDDVWARQGTGPWMQYTTTNLPPEVAASTGPVATELDAESRAQIEELDGQPETVNGVETTRYELNDEFFAAMSTALGEGADFNPADFEEFTGTVWIDNETHQAIKMEMRIVALPSAFGGFEGLPVPPDATVTMTFTHDLSQLNDSSVSIEAPE